MNRKELANDGRTREQDKRDELFAGNIKDAFFLIDERRLPGR